ncbi:phosphoenolpyruvate carboxykinase (GTP) [Lysobacter sp. Root96]|uniref:phosphoenolpyruvate carboxykinase (GTP) n=1 Tax=Lysobacter sp. Root96 TaxID=1736612 RepID=UPI0006F82FD5|nr:phosphoenolpyruvate carboxykinase (GTP) [Lysobacter sp. Root96]KRC38710.1 phosphoenolpyruvate carboxykinase [Lysobacter sp. Root76]KRD71087.1 phosphoenolpyruvate carboxykinase [Lysobacter sp. Root96]
MNALSKDVPTAPAPGSAGSRLAALNEWVAQVATLTRPDHIHWCDGSDAENAALIERMLADGTLEKLNGDTHPGSYLHRSHPDDVARVEHLTFVCTHERDDAGPNNHWMEPAEAHAKMDALYDGCMRGRTLYVIPYCMGPIDSPLSRCGVEITDSPYVVANMRIMTRMGAPALARIEREGAERAARGERNDTFVRGLHSIGELDPERRFIMHFPEELTIKSFGSGYGGNALLGKKCHALRIASHQARSEGWLAEHMLILGIENPQGEIHYVAAAFPSACGKTNLAMLIPPQGYRDAGWKVWTVGDDICWMRPGADGRLYAINPEAGFFGVAPGTSSKSNPNALATIQRDTIFTNVGVTADGQPWWEGLDNGQTPVTDWRGHPYDPAKGPAAHPNSRFTVSAKQCPSYSDKAEDAQGVPISAIVFGGRRASLVPLVFEARDWTHGVLVGAAMGSETTAAATGAVGVMRRDPMAMKPFCGYNFADYFSHWLSFDGEQVQLPKVFHVNWFRKGDDGKFLWPGFGDNLRVLEWMIGRVKGEAGAVETPIGHLPATTDLNLDGIGLSDEARAKLFGFDHAGWSAEFDSIGGYLDEYGPRMPQALKDEQQRIAAALAR